MSTRRHPSEAATIETLDRLQLRELLALVVNPRHPVIASRVALFRRLKLVRATEPPRPPLDSKARRRPPCRALGVTPLGIQTLIERGLLPQPPQQEASP